MGKAKKAPVVPNDTDIERYISGLTEDQVKAFYAMREFLYLKDSRQMFLLKGYAGTGKTFTISRLIQYAKDNEKHFNKWGDLAVALTAPTNKAVQVLRESSTADLKKHVNFKTVHQLLGLKERITDSGEIEFKASLDDIKMIQSMQIVVVDEVSMLQDELFYEIKNHCLNVKIIMMGDPAQIPPVGKEDCEPFLNPAQHEIKECTLQQIMRQKEGSQIIDLSMHIRNNEYNASDKINHEGGGDMTVCSRESRNTIIDMIKRKFSDQEAKDNNSYVKVIAWTNKKVKEYNAYIRSTFMRSHYPEHVAPYEKILVGDKMITNAPVIKSEGSKDKIVLTTNQEFEVTAVEKQEGEFTCADVTVRLGFYMMAVKYYDVEDEGYVSETIKTIHEVSEGAFARTLQGCKNSALHCPANRKGYYWREYYKFMRYFADVNYAYAITVHKSQGSTYLNTIVDANNIMNNQNIRERNRILYTAVTRAKNHLLIIN